MSVDLEAEIPLDKIYWSDSTDITDEQVKNMAASILVHGQVQPIVVCPHDEKGQYRGVIGRLRYEGMKERWSGEPEGKTILARVHSFNDEIEIKMWQLAENLHRRQVSAMQRARQYRELHELLSKQHGEEASVQTLATAIEDCTGNKESRATVQHYLSLTTLQPETQEVLTGEHMPLRYGLELLKIENAAKQVKAAKEIQKNPDLYKTVTDVKYCVEAYIEDQRRDKQRKRLQKKAEELRKTGKIVVIDAPYGDLSWDERQKFHDFWGDVPEKCNECPKLGVLLSGNFQQKPVCPDRKCYEAMEAEKRRKKQKEQKEIQQKFDVERAKVYDMEPDARHWRLAVFALIDSWVLLGLLGAERGRRLPDEAVWAALEKLDEKQCQSLLVRRAVEEILTGLQAWRGESFVKNWLIKEFGLTAEVFMAKEED